MIEFLKTVPLFEGIGDQDLREISSSLKLEVYEKGDWIFKEGEKSQAFYVIKTGSVGIFKKDGCVGRVHRVGSLGTHEGFGDTAFLGEEKRTASVQALERLEVVTIPLGVFSKQAETYPIFSTLSINFAKQVSKRLCRTDETLAELMEKEFSLLKAHDQMGRLLIHLFVLLTLFFFSVRVMDQVRSTVAVSHWIAALLILGFGLIGYVIVKKSGYPLEFYGVTFKHGWKHASEGVLLTLPLLVLMVGAKVLIIHFVPYFQGMSLFGVSTNHPEFLLSFWHHAKPVDVAQNFWLFLWIYLALVPVQEFIARGCLQSCLYNFFQSAHRTFFAIVMSNLLFALFHGFKSISFSLSACLLGMFWGWLYHRQRSLVGATVSHILVGAWAFGVLNYQSILVF